MLNFGYLAVIAISITIGCTFGICSVVSLDKDVNIEKYIKMYK